jgi:hypothetical protein
MIDLIKFIHVICALSLLGTTLYCFAFIGKHKRPVSVFTNKVILYISLLALLTGTMLVYPKHFTFHTPWIQAAYILIICYAGIIGLYHHYRNSFLFKYNPFLFLTYFILFILLILVVHDAVTKSTFLI